MGARSEGVIRVVEDGNEREITVLYTNRALAEIEQQLNRSIIDLAQGFQAGTTGVNDITHALRAGMEAHRRDAHISGRQVSVNDAFEILDKVGFPSVAAVVMGAIAEVLGYSPEGQDPNVKGSRSA